MLFFVKNLGAVFDSHMKMSNHITHLSRSLKFQIRNLNRIRWLLDFDSCHNAVRSLILSKLDYCGALLDGISQKNITHFQIIQMGVPGWFSKHQNTLMPFLCLRSSTGCQWPNVFNSAPLSIPSSPWTTSHLTTSPASSLYASHLLTPSDPPLSLVFMFQRHTPLTGDRAFSSAAPHLWNNLSATIRGTTTTASFKESLKCHLLVN